MKKVNLFLLFLMIAFNAVSQNQIIPAPVKYEATPDFFVFDVPLKFDIKTKDEEVKRLADWFAKTILKTDVSYEHRDAKHKTIIFDINDNPVVEIGAEGYQLEIKPNVIKISANKSAGIFNALQTLTQLLPAKIASNADLAKVKIEGCKITDYPRFAWRGLMLDVSRTFFTVEEVKQYIDMMAKYKFNVLHWHLTDDNGWRIEIKAYPKLTSVGAWRVERFGKFGVRDAPMVDEKTPVGGFYTQEQIKDIILFAADRNITIVPEIDVPGHSMALLAAYPELSTKKEPKYVSPGNKFSEWYGNGTFKMLVENTVSPIDEHVYGFLDTVFTEVAALFPGKYLHAGGDEAYHGFWEQDPACIDFMKKNGIKDSHGLQSYFMKRVEKIISSKGKTMIGWDEILDGGLADGAAVMSWRGMKGGIEAAKQGHEVVMSPTDFAYLDYTQGDKSVEFPIYASLSLKQAYNFEPIPDGVDAKYILGGQANLWTEQVPNIRHAFYMTYPRAFATAESVWSPKSAKQWSNFLARVETHFSRFDATDTKISKAIYDPIIKVKRQGGKLTCELSSDVPDVVLYYTVDNTFPDNFSTQYNQIIQIPKGELSLKVQAYRNNQPIGRMLSISRADLEKRTK